MPPGECRVVIAKDGFPVFCSKAWKISRTHHRKKGKRRDRGSALKKKGGGYLDRDPDSEGP